MKSPLQGLFFRRAAIWGATRAPVWFVRFAPVAIGVFLSFLLRPERARVRENLRLVLGQQTWFAETRQIAATFVEFAQSLTLGIAQDRLGAPSFDLVGRAALDQLISSEKGFILATCHVGYWDVVMQRAFSEAGRPVLVVMGGEARADAADFHDQTRDPHVTVVRLGTHPLDALPILRHLKGGGIVAVQLDRAAAFGETREAMLFGQSFQFAVGPFRLASLAEVPVVPVFTARTGVGRHLVRLGEPFELPREIHEAQLDEALARVLTQLQIHLAAFPTQWFRFRK